MKCFTENCRKFINIMDCLGELFNFVQLHFSKNELILTGVDINRTVYMKLQLKQNFFTQYEVDEQKIVVSLEHLNTVLRCGAKQDQMEISLTEDDSVLEIQFLNEAENKRGRFKISLKETKYENSMIKKIQTENYITMSSEMLSNSIRHLSHLADNLEIQAQNKSVRFNVQGNFSNGYIEFKEKGQTTLKIQKRFKQLFAFDILMRLCKLDKIEEKITLFFQENDNLVLLMDVETGGTLTFHLAPKFVAHN